MIDLAKRLADRFSADHELCLEVYYANVAGASLTR